MPVEPLSEQDIDRFATLFFPATPPGTPTATADVTPIAIDTAHPRTPSSSESDFGAFVSVPPSQDPLGRDTTPAHRHNRSLVYFDLFTSHAKFASERSKNDVLVELLEHEDDPMYFLDRDTHAETSTPPSGSISAPIPIPSPMSTDDALAEALASELHNPKLIRVERGGSVKVAPSPSKSRLPLPPRLSGSASPPSIVDSLPASPPKPSTSSAPAQATLSRLSSSLVSLLPPARPRSTAPLSTNSAPSTISRIASPFAHKSLTHGSPFASTPYIPPTGAPGFAGDRAWDRGFSEALEREEKQGLVDPMGLGISAGGEETSTDHNRTHARHTKGKGVVLLGRTPGTVRVLSEEIADLIRIHLPALTRLGYHWSLLYSLDQHGISLNTLYARCAPRVPSRAHPNVPQGGLLVIRDARDAVFGAWLSEGIRLEKSGYYGSGEAFLWRYHPPVDGDHQGRLDVYGWTGKNAYVALCETGFISFGGGDGHYGLYVDATLLDGSSAPCPTFGNPPLCATSSANSECHARDVAFECVGLEVWGIGLE